MLSSATWRERTFDAAVQAALEGRGVPPLVARVLAARGVVADDLEAFSDPSLRRLVPPGDLPGLAKAVRVIAPFVRDGREIVVFGDYDADGVCASAILVSTLRKLGARADAFIPERFGEGYGLTEASLNRLFAEHPAVALIVTVDNGITAAAEVAKLRARGISVVVTDHHLPPAAVDNAPAPIPVADALIDPKVASCPGCEDLCGAGVAFFLARALVDELRAHAETKGVLPRDARLAGPLVVLAGVATVADLMPLRGQNRVLVSAALSAFNAVAPIGMKELFIRAQRRVEVLTARDFAFLLAPRLNAAGRMKSATLAYDLLMTDDRERARDIACQIDLLNVERKQEEQRMAEEALAQIGADDGRAAVVVADARLPAGSKPWHSGVAGIVASRILERMHRPVAVVVGDHGSARAPNGYHIRLALDAAAETLTRYGGHAAAGGFTVREGRLDDFECLFAAAAAARRAEVPDAAAQLFDGWVEPADLTMDLYAEIKRLEPLGEGNPEPIFGLKGVYFADVRPMGAEGQHANCSFVGRTVPRGVWWGHGKDAEQIRAHASARYDVFFALMASEYGSPGLPHLELRLVDVRPTA